MKKTDPILTWFRRRGWKPFPFQQEAWEAYLHGASGLIHATTGTGKTFATYFGALKEALAEPPSTEKKAPLRILWITPLRALSHDTARALAEPLEELKLPWDVGMRTGDTSTGQRAKQRKRLPTVLVTTPESLALFLTREETREQFQDLRLIVVDEWHELLSTKRGSMLELCLARLKRWQPQLRIWGLSATLGNTEEAMHALLGPNTPGRLIQGKLPKSIVIDTLLPEVVERFPWAGHLGTTLVEQVARAIEEGQTTLVFTNTRAQCELWYQSLLKARPEWAGIMALHHGSLERKTREWVEEHLKLGTLRCVVCTSSLDLGVDFHPVDRVLQVGSPKGVARLLQRAGRSGHTPGGVSRVTCVPTHAFELIEMAAAREAVLEGKIESREPCQEPMDVLAQHLVTCALGGGFDESELYTEVTSTRSFANLSLERWHWVLDFVVRGGEPLKTYPDFRRVVIADDGQYRVNDRSIAYRHRLSIGTILSEASMIVQFVRGPKLGTVEEYFAAKMKPGDRFTFAGRVLQFVRIHEQTVFVKKAKGAPTTVARWMGSRMPLSSDLAQVVREQVAATARGDFPSPELECLRPIMEFQRERSHIPSRRELLIETWQSREGHHLYLYPFEGRLVHEGLAALIAYRISRWQPLTLSMAINDYGMEILSNEPLDFTEANFRTLLAPENLQHDLLKSVNTAELARRQFREVARVAGLVFPGLPHAGKSAKQLQASASLFYQVFREYDPANLLLVQAQKEVLERQMENERLQQALCRIADSDLIIRELPKPTPFAFPLLIERLRESLSSERLAERVKKMIRDFEVTS